MNFNYSKDGITVAAMLDTGEMGGDFLFVFVLHIDATESITRLVKR